MKKNQESDVGKASGVVWKMWLTMKLLFCFLLIKRIKPETSTGI